MDRITCISVPLSLNSALLKTAVHTDPSCVHDLSKIFQAMEILADRHEVADWFFKLNDACLQYAHNTMAQESLSQKPASATGAHSSRDVSCHVSKGTRSQSDIDTYCRILNFQNQAFACGRI
jgi:hypothetical protein